MEGPSHVPVDTTVAVPSKSILKKQLSHHCDSHHTSCSNSIASGEEKRGAKWDEMNILATYHPADKDYGHMKIDDPPTPFHEYTQELEDNENEMDLIVTDSSCAGVVSQPFSIGERGRKASFSDNTEMLDPDALTEKLTNAHGRESKHERTISSDTDEDANVTEEQRAKQSEFKNKRKDHYNEFQAVKLARQLLLQDEEEDEDDKPADTSME